MMPMSDTVRDLPTREQAHETVGHYDNAEMGNTPAAVVTAAYAAGDLMTREEWIATIDMEAASRMYFRLSGQHFIADPIIAAALGEDTE